MKFLFKLAIILTLANYLFATPIVDNLTMKKIEKLVQKEEDIAKAYKEYLLTNGSSPTSIQVLINNGFLPKGFNTINPFGTVMSIVSGKNLIEKFNTNDKNLKIALQDYYLNSKDREHTKLSLNEPFGTNTKDYIGIKLNSKEEFIFNNQSNISKTKTNGKFLLDDNGVLNYYKADGKLGYSFDKEIILDKSISIFNSNGIYNSNWSSGLNFTSDILKMGISIFDSNNISNSIEYIVVGPGQIVEINKEEKEYGKTIIQFNRRAGGMIVNGDIYTWGNNGNAIAGIDAKKSLTGGSSGSYQLFTTIVPFRAKIYDTINVSNNSTPKYQNKYYTENYFSSPKRPKFVDFFSSVYVGTCGVSIEGILYCSGTTANSPNSFKMYTDITKDNEELLYKSNKFDGVTFKAKKIFANNSIWHILGQDGNIYIWGTDSNGFGGQGISPQNLSNNPSYTYTKVQNISNIVDITYLTYLNNRRLGALDDKGNIFIWGSEGLTSCSLTWKNSSNKDVNYNICFPIKITLDSATITHFGENKGLPTFSLLKGGIDGFIAKDINNNFYRIRQENSSKIAVIDIRTIIKNWKYNDDWKYNEKDDENIISADLSRAIGNNSYYGTGIVWVNNKNELKGDIFVDDSQKKDILFIDSIRKIKWKQIKVIAENNAMCGIDINNQMYCWGEQVYYRTDSPGVTNQLGNTYMIPIFNTNLYALNKDFMVGEATPDNLTKIGYENWQPNNGKTFNMKYPTYIGGFNYEFEFK